MLGRKTSRVTFGEASGDWEAEPTTLALSSQRGCSLMILRAWAPGSPEVLSWSPFLLFEESIAHCLLAPFHWGPAKPPKGPRQHSLKTTDSIPSFYRERNPWKVEKRGKVTKVRDRRQKKCMSEKESALSYFPLTALHCNSRTPVRAVLPHLGINCEKHPAWPGNKRGLERVSGAWCPRGTKRLEEVALRILMIKRVCTL